MDVGACVDDIVSYSLTKKYSTMESNKQAVVRDYDFSDGTLEQLADYLKQNLTRDLAKLAARGITAATITYLESLRDTFSEQPSDTEALGVITTAVEVKNAARDAALVDARRLRTAAQNVFDVNSGKYHRFGFSDMDKLSDNDLPRALRTMYRVGSKLQGELAGEGIDTTFLEDFKAHIKTIDDELENVRQAEEERDVATEGRIASGNSLYKEVARLCNIGKDVFVTISQALYNDYVIMNFTGTGETGLDDYHIRALDVPAGGSLLIPLGAGGLAPDLQLYLRAVNGSVIICATNLPANPCTTGYELLQGVTFKDAAEKLNLDKDKTNLQITNPGLTAVTVRAGIKK